MVNLGRQPRSRFKKLAYPMVSRLTLIGLVTLATCFDAMNLRLAVNFQGIPVFTIMILVTLTRFLSLPTVFAYLFLSFIIMPFLFQSGWCASFQTLLLIALTWLSKKYVRKISFNLFWVTVTGLLSLMTLLASYHGYPVSFLMVVKYIFTALFLFLSFPIIYMLTFKILKIKAQNTPQKRARVQKKRGEL